MTTRSTRTKTSDARLIAVVLAGGAARRFGADKLAAPLDGGPLLDRVIAALPESAGVFVVGPDRPTARTVTWLREDPPGGGPTAGLVCGLRAALDADADLVLVLPGDAPGAGPAALHLLDRLLADPSCGAVVGVDDTGHEQPLQLALRGRAAARLVETAGVGAGANASARALLRRLHPPALGVPLTPTQVFDVDTPEQLLVWRLAHSPAVDRLVALVDARRTDPLRPPGRPVVVALVGSSGSDRSTLASALRLRTGGVVLGSEVADPAVMPVLGAAESSPPAAEVIIVDGVSGTRPELDERADLRFDVAADGYVGSLAGTASPKEPNSEERNVIDPSQGAPDTPEVGDVDTESLYGAPPDGSGDADPVEVDPDGPYTGQESDPEGGSSDSSPGVTSPA